MNAHAQPFLVHAARTAEERSFQAHDGTQIFFRKWAAPLHQPRRGTAILLHRGHEHSARLEHLIDEKAFEGMDIYAWDARGHGRSEGARGGAPDFGTLVRDLDTFARHIVDADGVDLEETSLVAQSVGAVIAATWVHDYAPPIRAMVLAVPAFDVNLVVPFARPALSIWQKLRGPFTVRSYVDGKMLSSDAKRAASYDSDPLVSRAIASNVLMDLHATAERVVTDAGAITVPTQVLLAGADKVVRPEAAHHFFDNLGTARKERHGFPGLRHDILGEPDRAPVLAAIDGFLRGCIERPVAAPDLTRADREGYTKDEATSLSLPLPSLSPRRLTWAATRAAIRVGSHLSNGLRIGRKTGFDSGTMLDYVYRNRAEGTGPLGRAIDRTYLDSIGWRGIRQRKVHAEEIITLALARLAEQGMPAHLVDIAAGHGRYVLEALDAADRKPDSILLRDYCPRNVASGSELIAAKRLSDIARFEQGDAFDGDSLAALDPRPTLAIVSGLYELFPENAPVQASLDGLARAVPEGGLLVYTGQPWHPQLEMIARTLTSHRDGQPWVMRRRTQAEMDALVARAGFRKIEQRIDPWGIFTVSLAVRVAS